MNFCKKYKGMFCVMDTAHYLATRQQNIPYMPVMEISVSVVTNKSNRATPAHQITKYKQSKYRTLWQSKEYREQCRCNDCKSIRKKSEHTRSQTNGIRTLRTGSHIAGISIIHILTTPVLIKEMMIEIRKGWKNQIRGKWFLIKKSTRTQTVKNMM